MVWNTPANELERREKEVLSQCHAQESSYEWLAACVGRQQMGSAMQVLFKEQSTFWRARGAMRSLRKEFEPSRQCWPDRQKTMEELRPARLLHKAFDVISEFEKGQAQLEQLEKVMSFKVIKCAGTRVAYILHGDLRFTVAGVSKWTSEERDQILAAALES